jgi:UDP-N-acetylglucosamine acyltransferase
MSTIHSTALIDSRAELDSSVVVGPYTIIGPNVRIAAGTTVGAHCVIDGHTTIGRGNSIFQFNSLGAIPQDKKYHGEPCELLIGDRNTIREFCTLNIGSPGDLGYTELGNDNWLMAYVHIAHDCIVGNHTIFANSTQLAGHVRVGDWAIFGGYTGVHQFVHIGDHCMTGIHSTIVADLPPFVMCMGSPSIARSMNFEGLRRRGWSPGRLAVIKKMFKIIYREGLKIEQACINMQIIATESEESRSDIDAMCQFLMRAKDGRGIVR